MRNEYFPFSELGLFSPLGTFHDGGIPFNLHRTIKSLDGTLYVPYPKELENRQRDQERSPI